MLQIVIDSNNAYFELGLQHLLSKINNRNDQGDNVPLTFSLLQRGASLPDVIFRDFMVTVNIKHGTDCRNSNSLAETSRTIHIPFICKSHSMDDIILRIRKVLLIASIGYGASTRTDIFKAAGLKRYLQLSVTENNIMMLTGKGHDASDISRLLHRSERTIGVHCRNAIKKMGMENRLEFYKYATWLARFGNSDEITLCL
ncbi:helix-turn-helix domain-containing protein [Siccibacter turicensis]|uniref:helix-turn-helix domain-containing protein n=1 Tax=Siccibacter turicensis TaxID=357233 RepID=UPI000463E8FA|nr:LuxR family transcriptional regulator [Siccibacter turicensis]